MRFMGTITVELSDRTREKWKDRDAAKHVSSEGRCHWWTHDFQTTRDDDLIVTRLGTSVASEWRLITEGTTLWSAQQNARHPFSSYEYEVARYRAGTWVTAKRKSPS